jgi:hypothetical protein
MTENKAVLVIGLEPTLIDFSHPDYASTGQGLDAAKVLAGSQVLGERIVSPRL